jgi:hypothetical protein
MQLETMFQCHFQFCLQPTPTHLMNAILHRWSVSSVFVVKFSCKLDCTCSLLFTKRSLIASMGAHLPFRLTHSIRRLEQPFYSLVPQNRLFNTESVTISTPLSATTSVSHRLIRWSSCGSASFLLPLSSTSGHVELSQDACQTESGDIDTSGVIQASPASAQPSSAGGDRSCEEGQSASPLLSPALVPLCATPPHASLPVS